MKPSARSKPNNGFALVTTILMMGLLSVIVIATLSLSSVTLRAVERDALNAVAKANARMALMIAIGRLQESAGPDQRVTATADLKGIHANPGWMGVWKTGPDDLKSEPVWMVSGHRPDPSNELNRKDSALLVSMPKEQPASRDIRAEYVDVVNGRSKGRYAFWIGDEGVKARVDVARPAKDEAISSSEKVAHAQSPQEPGLSVFDKGNQVMWASFDPRGTDEPNKKLLVSMETVALAVGNSPALKRDDFSKHYFNDLTTGGSGLPVNVRDGGFKADLSLIFDRSKQDQEFVSDFIGAKPVAAKVLKTDVLGFSVSDPAKFGLSGQITKGHDGGFVGPNWGSLFNYARLWEKVAGNTVPMIGPHPRADSDLRQGDWSPYQEAHKGEANREDIQHTNSALSPVLSVAQLGFYFGAKEGAPSVGTLKRYYAELMVKPIIGLWNPYNVRINDSQYMIEWAVAPYMRFDYQIPNADGSFNSNSGNRVEIWMREYWMAQDGGKFPTDEAGQGGSYLRLVTRPVDFEPGEFRLFSAEGNPEMSAGYNNYLVPTLDPSGAFSMRIIRSEAGKLKGSNGKLLPDQNIGQPLMIPTGYYGWFGDVYLQDTHWDGKTRKYGTGTRARFPKLDENATPTWLSVKSVADVTPEMIGDVTHLSRYTNLWNGGRDDTVVVNGGFIPEPIISARAKMNVSGAGGRTPYLIDSLTEGRLGHIGTWRFHARTSTELQDPSQGLRGWIDSNPRVIASNVKFDGSKNDTGGKQGWNVSSNLIPGASDITFGDYLGGNRGLVSDGSWGKESRIPEGEPEPERWRGYGGPASTLGAGGQTHVIVYDVPQSPLVSVGQFQHAELSRYNFEPGFVVGNSYANPRIPPDQTINPDLGEMGFSVVDISHDVNTRLWDTTFFSTLSPDYLGGADSDFDGALRDVLSRKKSLPNPRMEFVTIPGDPLDRAGHPSVDKLIEKSGARAPQAVAARMRVTGAFNVNSTSKTAWKAILSSMGASELPVIHPSTLSTSWSNPKGIRFNRFVHPILDSAYSGGDAQAAFWQGWRELSEENLDQLAGAIVEEVKERGPFRSMADFVNRNPKSEDTDHRLKGALQAAIDKVANNSLPSSVGLPSANPSGGAFFQTISGENQTAGHAAYLLQGDLLQSLAPILQVRSDYFRIRTCGEALDRNGKVVAKATCEAFVQRIPEFVDRGDKPEAIEITRNVNKVFGRRFQLVSFRWLNQSEI